MLSVHSSDFSAGGRVVLWLIKMLFLVVLYLVGYAFGDLLHGKFYFHYWCVLCPSIFSNATIIRHFATRPFHNYLEFTYTRAVSLFTFNRAKTTDSDLIRFDSLGSVESKTSRVYVVSEIIME